jgi:hypothetical protein
VKYLCSFPAHAPDTWTEVETYDRETAAEEYVAQLCERETACYVSFERGAVVLVKVAGGAARAFEVTMDLHPRFTAKVVL